MLNLALAALAAAPQSPVPAHAHPHAATPPATGMHWGDYDADGFADAVALLPGGEARLLRNLGDGTLEDVTALVGLPEDLSAKLALWGDYDADGALDLYLGSLDGESRLWRQIAGTFQDVTERLGLEPTVAPVAARWIDYDGDATADLHLSTASGEVLYHGLGGTAFERVDLGLSTPSATGASVPTGAARVASASPVARAPAAEGPGPDRTDADTARTGGTGGRTDLTVSGVTRAPGGTAAVGTGICVDGLFDQNGGGCIQASSVPTVGMLYPMSSDLNVGVSGRVGIGTLIHVADLTVDGVGLNDIVRVRRDGFTQFGVYANGRVGIGSSFFGPLARLEIQGGSEDRLRIEAGANSFVVQSDGDVGIGTTTPAARLHVNAGSSAFVVQSDGNVGVGTGTPEVRLQVLGGTDASVSGGGYAILGNSTGPNIVLDDNEILARDNGANATLGLNVEGGDLRTGGNLELLGDDRKIEFIETTTPAASLFYDGAGLSGGANRVHLRSELSGETRNVMTWELGGDVGIGTNTPETRLQISGGSDASLGGGGYIQLGSQSSGNIAIDNDEIMARNNGVATQLNLNADGGDVLMLGNSSTGEVGIGTSSPNDRLDVVGNIRSRGSSGGRFSAYNPANQSAAVSLDWLNDQARIRIGGGGAGSTNGLDIQGGNDTSLMRIDGNGDVGIGTNTPETRLQVSGGTDASVGGGGYIQLGSQSGGNIAIDNNEIMARTNGVATALNLNADGGDVLMLGNASTGRVGIGTSSPAFLLHVNGSAGKPGGGLWGMASDARLKKNVEDLDGALERLMQLRGVTYEYIDPDAIGELPGERVGFIAQEVEQVLPDWVEEGDDGYKRLHVRGFTALAVEALRDLRNEKDAQIARLEGEVAELRERVAQLSSIEAELAGLRTSLQALAADR